MCFYQLCMRYFLEIAYKGTNYHGWQIQQNANTIQQEINNALSKVLQCEIKTTGSSRTDTGVHALQQFAHFDITNGIKNVSNILFKLNCILPEDIVIKNIYKVKDDAHARYDAISRSYEYRICKSKDPFLKDTTYFYSRTLNIDKMNKAANLHLSYKDFTSYSKQDTKAKNNITKDAIVKLVSLIIIAIAFLIVRLFFSYLISHTKINIHPTNNTIHIIINKSQSILVGDIASLIYLASLKRYNGKNNASKVQIAPCHLSIIHLTKDNIFKLCFILG